GVKPDDSQPVEVDRSQVPTGRADGLLLQQRQAPKVIDTADLVRPDGPFPEQLAIVRHRRCGLLHEPLELLCLRSFVLRGGPPLALVKRVQVTAEMLAVLPPPVTKAVTGRNQVLDQRRAPLVDLLQPLAAVPHGRLAPG